MDKYFAEMESMASSNCESGLWQVQKFKIVYKYAF